MRVKLMAQRDNHQFDKMPRIIIVESDEDISDALRLFLEMELSAEIAVFDENSAALKAIEEMKPDLIITDILHRGEDGTRDVG